MHDAVFTLCGAAREQQRKIAESVVHGPIETW
jgi:hypothetical protein